MELINILVSLNMLDLLATFVTSVFLHLFIFYIITKEYLGKEFKERFNYLLINRYNLIIILYFIIIVIINYYLKKNAVYLDENVVLTTKIQNSEITLSGEILNQILENFGSAGVFIVGAKIAAALVAKHPMALPNKIGVIGGTGAVFNIAYRIVNRNQLLSNNIGNVPSISVGTGPIEIKLEGIKYANNVNNTEFKSLLDKYFGISKSLHNLDYNENFNVNTNTLEIISNGEQTSKVIDELDKFNPNWRDNFINSPLESENPVTQFILNSLMDSLMLDFISIYLL